MKRPYNKDISPKDINKRRRTMAYTSSTSEDEQPSTSGSSAATRQKVADTALNMATFTITQRAPPKHIKKYNAMQNSFFIKVNPHLDKIKSLADYLNMLRELLQALLDRVEAQSNDLVRIVLTPLSLERPISIPLIRFADYNPAMILDFVAGVYQSHEEFITDETFQVDISVIREPRGLGRSKELIFTYQEFIQNKRGIIRINSNDGLCLPSALLIAQAYADDNQRRREYFIRSGTTKARVNKLRQQAKALVEQIFPEYDWRQGFTLLDLDTFHKQYFSNYVIKVFQVVPVRKCIWSSHTKMPPNAKVMVLLKHNDHFDVISRLPGFFDAKGYCHKCDRAYKDARRHKCLLLCKGCRRTTCSSLKEAFETISCVDCGRSFYGNDCYAYHKKTSNGTNVSLCKRLRYCNECGRLTAEWGRNINKPHICGSVYCNNCKNFVEFSHRCFIKPLALNEQYNASEDENEETTTTMNITSNNSTINAHVNVGEAAVCIQSLLGLEDEEFNNRISLSDFHASSQNEENENGVIIRECENFERSLYAYFDIEAYPEFSTGIHHANLVVVQWDSLQGEGNETVTQEKIFAEREQSNVIDAFCTWVFTRAHKDWTFVSHYGKIYDNFFVVQWLLSKTNLNIRLITNGASIMLLEVKKAGVRFIDSGLFMQCSLSKLPDMFGFTEEVRKGWFPHEFNRPENYNYCGPMPPITVYEPSRMAPGKRVEFETWYGQQSNRLFDFWNELTSYCQDDVRVLRKACTSFRRLFFMHTRVDPFKYITIASACNAVFRKIFLKPDTIAVIDPHVYDNSANHSYKSFLWLQWEREKTGKDIRHARNGGELRIVLPCGRKVRPDGYVITEKIVYEFYGCFFHGCVKCYRPGTFNNKLRSPMESLYQQTLNRARMLRMYGYTVRSIWECEFKTMSEEDSDLKAFVKKYPRHPPLNPRDSFYGGRTNATVLFHRIHPNSIGRIHYYDINSLYPFVNKNCIYPVGHPNIFEAQDVNLAKVTTQYYFGLIKGCVLPPSNLLHPILPVRHRKKLMFTLCRSCMEEQDHISSCKHHVEERVIEGTWCTPEFYEALDNGYNIIRIDSVWHWNQSSSELFRDYINCFLKLKQEARGWPAHVHSKTDQLQYVDDFFRLEGVRLDPENVKNNPGLYAIAKLCLNSFWGKFGQRSGLPNTKLFDNEAEFWTFIKSDQYHIQDICFPSDDYAQVQYQEQKEFAEPGIHTNVVIAAFTTTYARLKLWRNLNQLGDSVLYFDTDSIIFYDPDPNDKAWFRPTTGDHLGVFKDELGQDDYIVAFCSAGPKNYGYETAKGKKCLKVRGFTLNFLAQRSLNYEAVRDMILDRHINDGHAISVNMGTKISRDQTDWVLYTEQDRKMYKINYDKRRRLTDFVTVPWGYSGIVPWPAP